MKTPDFCRIYQILRDNSTDLKHFGLDESCHLRNSGHHNTTWESACQELHLIFIMALHHPSFTFEERHHLREIYGSLQSNRLLAVPRTPSPPVITPTPTPSPPEVVATKAVSVSVPVACPASEQQSDQKLGQRPDKPSKHHPDQLSDQPSDHTSDQRSNHRPDQRSDRSDRADPKSDRPEQRHDQRSPTNCRNSSRASATGQHSSVSSSRRPHGPRNVQRSNHNHSNSNGSISEPGCNGGNCNISVLLKEQLGAGQQHPNFNTLPKGWKQFERLSPAELSNYSDQDFINSDLTPSFISVLRKVLNQLQCGQGPSQQNHPTAGPNSGGVVSSRSSSSNGLTEEGSYHHCRQSPSVVQPQQQQKQHQQVMLLMSFILLEFV